MALIAFFTLTIIIALYKSDRVKAKISEMRVSMGVKAQWTDLYLSNHNLIIKNSLLFLFNWKGAIILNLVYRLYLFYRMFLALLILPGLTKLSQSIILEWIHWKSISKISFTRVKLFMLQFVIFSWLYLTKKIFNLGKTFNDLLIT